MSEGSEEFAALHRRGQPLFLPNAWDYASALVLAQAGYPAIGTTSLGVAAAAGKVDGAGTARVETVTLIARLASLGVLLTADLEGGFSDDPVEVSALVEEVSAAGAVGINLEDGRSDGTMMSVDRQCAKIAAIKSGTPEIFVNARTDAFWLANESASHAAADSLRRARAYIESGADGIFVPGVEDLATVAYLSEQIEAPLNILYLPGKHTLHALAEAGAARVSTGSLLFRASLQAVLRTAQLAATAVVEDDPQRPTYRQIQNALTGT